MGYDPKAVLVKKATKVMSGGNKFFIKLIKQATEQAQRQAFSKKRSKNTDNE